MLSVDLHFPEQDYQRGGEHLVVERCDDRVCHSALSWKVEDGGWRVRGLASLDINIYIPLKGAAHSLHGQILELRNGMTREHNCVHRHDSDKK